MKAANKESATAALRARLAILLLPAAVMWVTEIADQVIFNGGLDRSGIMPRTLSGLKGILFAPFLHHGFVHLIANTVPFLVLGGFVLLRGVGRFLTVTVIVCLIGGLGTWLTGGGNTVHVGASGVVYGYLGALLGAAFFERRVISVVLAIAGGSLYGGILWGVLPGQAGISWEGHLFGFVGGVISAKLLTRTTAA